MGRQVYRQDRRGLVAFQSDVSGAQLMDSIGDYLLLLAVVICGGVVYLAALLRFINWIIKRR
jgi:hypothetical protein